jgi:hypothetical protein
LSEFGVFYCWALSRHYPRWFDDLEREDELWGLLTRVDYAAIMGFELEFEALRRCTSLTGTPSIARQWADIGQRARRSILLQLARSLRLSGLSTSDALAGYRASWWQDASSLHVPGKWGTWLDCDEGGFTHYLVSTVHTARHWIVTAGGTVSAAEPVEMMPAGYKIDGERPRCGSEVSWRLPRRLANGDKPTTLYLKRRRDRRPRRLAYNYGRPLELQGTTVYRGWASETPYLVTAVS